jgi:ribosomal peptide maturation radical SAM protein 1
MNIVLVSTPWPLFNRPSIQLGTLSAFVKRHLPDVRVTANHAYLDVAAELGYDLYKEISERTWLAESVYAALLYPEKLETIARFWYRRARGLLSLQGTSFQGLCSRARAASDKILDQVPWEQFQLAGFSICFGQLTSTLYFVGQLKKRNPSLRVVAGGSACAGELGESLLNNIPEIDFVVQGEGELPLTQLTEVLGNSETVGEPIAGLLTRNKGESASPTSQIEQLDEMPPPDYQDYFDHLRSLGPHKLFLPRIPVEMSRGCWWRKRMRPGDKLSGCAFCNLNLQWDGYRSKSPWRVTEELDQLANRYEILSLSFMDNLLPGKGLGELFRRLGELEKDLRLFAEIRATTPLDVLRSMGSAGMAEVQVGIEALSNSLLKKLNKGTSAIDNVEIMKNCERRDTPILTGNLIFQFPSSDGRDVTETLDNLSFVLPFRPLKGIPFWLGYGSPVWHAPKEYGIRRVGNHPYYKQLFPPDVLRGLRLMIQGYQGSVRHQQRLWKPVQEAMARWKNHYESLHRKADAGPILSYQDGGDFMIIRHRRLGEDDMTHRLRGTSREIYLFCSTQRKMSEIQSRFPGFGEEKIRSFLQTMVGKRLMFCEGDRWLSLAIPFRSTPTP